MPRSSWFDEHSNAMQFDQYMTQMASWREAMADGKIEPDELLRQARRVEDLLRAFEPKLSDAQHEELTHIFLELTVFYGMQRIADLAAAGGPE